jgi:regulator of protease activity HflC (stomatin/prohibitin superfamily)
MGFYAAAFTRELKRYYQATEQEPAMTFAVFLGLGFELRADFTVPPGEVWVLERLTPLQKAAGFEPRILGKITDLAR